MTEIAKHRLYSVGGRATVAFSTFLFSSPFILFAIYLLDRAIS